MKTFFTLAIALFSLPAFAGQESHGGNVLLCPGKEPVVLDYYNAMLPAPNDPAPNVEQIEGMSTQKVIRLLGNKLGSSSLGIAFEEARYLIGNIDLWALADNLVDVHDQNLEYPVPSGCTLKQAAVRQGTGVLIDSEVAKAISPAQLGILVVHELLFYMAAQNGQMDSSGVRAAMRILMRKNVDYTGLDAISAGLGVKKFWQQAREAHLSETTMYRCDDGAEKCGSIKKIWLNWDRSTTNQVHVQV
ncbi:MAG: hypothetical protein ACXVCK_21940, partial [Bdellovibrionota bacterium]